MNAGNFTVWKTPLNFHLCGENFSKSYQLRNIFISDDNIKNYENHDNDASDENEENEENYDNFERKRPFWARH